MNTSTTDPAPPPAGPLYRHLVVTTVVQCLVVVGVELTVFGAATAGLRAAGRGRLGGALLLLYAVNRVLMEVWDQ